MSVADEIIKKYKRGEVVVYNDQRWLQTVRDIQVRADLGYILITLKTSLESSYVMVDELGSIWKYQYIRTQGHGNEWKNRNLVQAWGRVQFVDSECRNGEIVTRVVAFREGISTDYAFMPMSAVRQSITV